MGESPSDLVVISYARTAIGAFGGGFRFTPAYDLGAAAIKGALERAGITGDDVDEVYFGHARQAGNGPNPGRTAAVRGGVRKDANVCTLTNACPSSMKALISGAQSILAGDNKTLVIGGHESMSTIPYLLKDIRWEGTKLGDRVLMDGWNDTIDPLCDMSMGLTAENLADIHSIGREEQDVWALESNRKAVAAQKGGHFAREIVPVEVEPRSAKESSYVVSTDENIRTDSTLEKLARLRPVFKENGTVTAGNASKMGDGGAAMVLTTREIAVGLGVTPLFSIVCWVSTAVEPARMGEGPGVAIRMVLERAGLVLSDMDLIEVNEAFASQCLANERQLSWDRSKVNVWGGAVAIGHPPGRTGARLIGTLDSQLRVHDKEIGVASICGGGGVSTAVIIKRES